MKFLSVFVALLSLPLVQPLATEAPTDIFTSAPSSSGPLECPYGYEKVPICVEKSTPAPTQENGCLAGESFVEFTIWLDDYPSEIYYEMYSMELQWYCYTDWWCQYGNEYTEYPYPYDNNTDYPVDYHVEYKKDVDTDGEYPSEEPDIKPECEYCYWSWDYRSIFSGNQLKAFPGKKIYQTACVPRGYSFYFWINDYYGDGICCGYGEGNFTIAIDGEVVQTGGDFGYYDYYEHFVGDGNDYYSWRYRNDVPKKGDTIGNLVGIEVNEEAPPKGLNVADLKGYGPVPKPFLPPGVQIHDDKLTLSMPILNK